MGFYRILQAQDSAKSILSNNNNSHCENVTCTCKFSKVVSDIERNHNEDSNLMQKSCYRKFFNSKAIKRLLLYLIGSLAFVSSGASIAWSSSYTFREIYSSVFISTSLSWTVAALPLAATLSPLLLFKVYHKIALKTLILFSIIVLSLSWTCMYLRTIHIVVLYVARILAGLGTGAIYMLVPTYLNQFTTSTNKSKIDTYVYGMLILGALIGYALDFYVNDSVTAVIMIVTSLMSVTCFAWCPQSPQHLIKQHKYAEAKHLLMKFLESDEEILLKIQQWTLEFNKTNDFKKLFERKSWVERLIPLFGLIIFDALLGILVILFYLKPILYFTGGSYSVSIKIISICSGLIVGTILKSPFSHLIQTKATTLISTSIVCCILLVLGTFHHLKSLGFSAIMDKNMYISIISLFLLGFIYSSGVYYNTRRYLYALNGTDHHFTVQVLTASLSWFTVAIVCFKLNHAIWYFGIGWLFYNMATVAIFLFGFISLLLPSLIKDVVVIDVDNDGSELSSGSERSKVSVSESTSTDITIDNILVS